MPAILYILILANILLIFFSFFWLSIILTLCGIILFFLKKEYFYIILLLSSLCFVYFFHYRNNINLKLKISDEIFINTELMITGFPEKRRDNKYYVEAYPFLIVLDEEMFLYRSEIISVAGFVRNHNTIIAKEIEVKKEGNIIFKFFGIIRENLIKKAEKIENERFRSLIYAFIMGNKSQLDFETKENFRLTGLFHLLAISGLHIGIIVMFVDFIAGLFLRRNLRYPLILVSILFYIVLSGLSPPVMRAGLMFLIYFYHRMKGLKVEMFDILLFTSVFSVLISPEAIFKLSFWLSYLSVAGIYFFYKPVKVLFSGLPELISTSFSLTLSANIAIFPVLLYVFGSVSLLSFVSNLVVIPLFSLFMVVLFLNFILAFFFPDFASLIFVNLTEVIFKLIFRFVEILSYVPLNLNLKVDLLTMICLYVAIGLLFLIPRISFELRLRRLREILG